MSSDYKECMADSAKKVKMSMSDKELRKIYDSELLVRVANAFDFKKFKKSMKSKNTKLIINERLRKLCATLNKTKTTKTKTKTKKRR